MREFPNLRFHFNMSTTVQSCITIYFAKRKQKLYVSAKTASFQRYLARGSHSSIWLQLYGEFTDTNILFLTVWTNNIRALTVWTNNIRALTVWTSNKRALTVWTSNIRALTVWTSNIRALLDITNIFPRQCFLVLGKC